MPEGRQSGIPARKSRLTTVPQSFQSHPDIEEDDRYYQTARMHTSARRYTNTEGQEVIERGNKRMVIHRQPPPLPTSPARRHHWLVLVGLGMLAMIILFMAGSWVVSSWQAHQLDATYGYPRTYQTDAVVGHNDSPDHPSHFLFLNLHGHVVIIEMPGGDVSRTRVYSGPTLFGPNADQIPVTGSFEDRNGDGKPDMVVHIQQQTIVYLNDSTQFKTQQ